MVPSDLVKEVERLHDAAFGWARACCGGRRDEAEDVLQTTYLKILDGRATFGGRSTVRTWLFGIIRRTAAEHRRRLFARTRSLHADRAVETEAASGVEDHASLERARALRTAVAKLSRRQKEVLHLVFYEEMTVEEAAGVMNVSVGAARVHYHRGKRRLRELLEGSR